MSSQNFKECPPDLRVSELSLRSKATQKVKSKMLEAVYQKYFHDHPEQVFWSDLDSDHIDVIDDMYRNIEYCWLTVGAAPDFDPKKLEWALIHAPRKYWEKWLACIEFHTKSGGHPHVHLIFKVRPDMKTNRQKLLDDLKVKFQGCFDPSVGSSFKFSCPRVPEQKLNYVLGRKAAPKMADCAKDVIWRERNGLRQVYGEWSDIPNLVVAPQLPPDISALIASSQSGKTEKL